MTHPTPPMPTAETPAAARADVAGDTPERIVVYAFDIYGEARALLPHSAPDNLSGWTEYVRADLAASLPRHDVADGGGDEPLSAEDEALIDWGWDTFKAGLPVATVINDNQPGRAFIAEAEEHTPTLMVGTKLYLAPQPLPRADGPAGGELRPLVWEADQDTWMPEGTAYAAADPWGERYRVFEQTEGWIAEHDNLIFEYAEAQPTLEAAKAICQSDYESRIWSCWLAVPAAPTPARALREAALGPRPAQMTCRGCPAHQEEHWREPSGDGETWDSGTYNRCQAAGSQVIDGAYGSVLPMPPEWCPALATPPEPEESAPAVPARKLALDAACEAAERLRAEWRAKPTDYTEGARHGAVMVCDAVAAALATPPEPEESAHER